MASCEAPEDGTNTDAVDQNMTKICGETFEYSCHIGYETTDSLTTVCRLDGNWTEPAPNCTGTRAILKYL